MSWVMFFDFSLHGLSLVLALAHLDQDVFRSDESTLWSFLNVYRLVVPLLNVASLGF